MVFRIKCARSMGTATSSNEFVELLTGLIRSGSYVSKGGQSLGLEIKIF